MKFVRDVKRGSETFAGMDVLSKVVCPFGRSDELSGTEYATEGQYGKEWTREQGKAANTFDQTSEAL